MGLGLPAAARVGQRLEQVYHKGSTHFRVRCGSSSGQSNHSSNSNPDGAHIYQRLEQVYQLGSTHFRARCSSSSCHREAANCRSFRRSFRPSRSRTNDSHPRPSRIQSCPHSLEARQPRRFSVSRRPASAQAASSARAYLNSGKSPSRGRSRPAEACSSRREISYRWRGARKSRHHSSRSVCIAA